jgi:hypothetical protein
VTPDDYDGAKTELGLAVDNVVVAPESWLSP